ncbi:hypothetical protein SNE40_012515 [Patella caerulea]|uniref:EF-hand domain-containing protein n=1 Tax=Patella caerulea TaxID=87958 RepID=A0AAN8PND7_PATCE
MFCLLVITLALVLAQNTEANMPVTGLTALDLQSQMGIGLDVAQELVATFDTNGDRMLSTAEMGFRFMATVKAVEDAKKKGISIDLAGIETMVDLDLGNMLNIDAYIEARLGGGGGGMGLGNLLGGNRGIGSLTDTLGLLGSLGMK